jgi:hypothetical protein
MMTITNEDDDDNGKYGCLFYFISFSLILLSPFGRFLAAASIGCSQEQLITDIPEK